MLLRRITKHFTDQNWFAVFIDFLIVVVGVFIGIQVANWNEGRIESQLSQDYTKRLIVDLQGDLAGWKNNYSYYNDVLKSVQEADRLLSDTDSNPKALIVTAYRASEYNGNPTNQATWNQIVSSGHLALLPKASIGIGVSDYYKFLDITIENRVLDSP